MMYKRIASRWIAASLFSLVALAPASQAAPIKFDFVFNHGNGVVQTQPVGSVNYAGSAPGSSMTATAYARTGGTDWSTLAGTSNVRISHFDSLADGDGIGVNSRNETGATSAIDSTGSYLEGILFDFGALDLSSATVYLGAVQSWEKVVFQWGDGPFNPLRTAPQLANTSGDVTIETSGTATGIAREFAVTLNGLGGARYLFVQAASDGVTGTNCGNSPINCFRVNGIDVATVPEPDSLALLGLGVFGFGLTRRRKTR